MFSLLHHPFSLAVLVTDDSTCSRTSAVWLHFWLFLGDGGQTMSLWFHTTAPHAVDLHPFHFQSEKLVKVTQLCPALCSPMDCRLLGSSVHGIHHASILEWVAIYFSRESSRPKDGTWVSCVAGRLFSIWVTKVDFSFLFFFLVEWQSGVKAGQVIRASQQMHWCYTCYTHNAVLVFWRVEKSYIWSLNSWCFHR